MDTTLQNRHSHHRYYHHHSYSAKKHVNWQAAFFISQLIRAARRRNTILEDIAFLEEEYQKNGFWKENLCEVVQKFFHGYVYGHCGYITPSLEAFGRLFLTQKGNLRCALEKDAVRAGNVRVGAYHFCFDNSVTGASSLVFADEQNERYFLGQLYAYPTEECTFGKLFIVAASKRKGSLCRVLEEVVTRAGGSSEEKSLAYDFLTYMRFRASLFCFDSSLEGIASSLVFADAQSECGQRYLLDQLYAYSPKDRTKKWEALRLYIERTFFAQAAALSSTQNRWEALVSIFFSLRMVHEQRMELDLCLEELLKKMLEQMLFCAKEGQSLGCFWVVYVQSQEFGYLSIAGETERLIMELIPDFDGDNKRYLCVFRFLFHSCTKPWGRYRSDNERTKDGLPVRPFNMPSQTMVEYFISLVEKSNWPLNEYDSCQKMCITEGNETLQRVIAKKIEERILPIAGDITPNRYESLLSLLEEKGVSEPSFILLILYGAEPKLENLALYWWGKELSKRCLERLGLYFECYTMEKCRQKIAIHFDAKYLELLARKEKGEKLEPCEDLDRAVPVSLSVARMLIPYVWSKECREYLHRITSAVPA